MEKAPDTRTVFLIYDKMDHGHAIFDADLFDGCAAVGEYDAHLPTDWREYQPVALVKVLGQARLQWSPDRKRWLYRDDLMVPATAANILLEEPPSVDVCRLESFYDKEAAGRLREPPSKLN